MSECVCVCVCVCDIIMMSSLCCCLTGVQIADFGMSRDLMDENYYISSGGKIPVKWTAPEVRASPSLVALCSSSSHIVFFLSPTGPPLQEVLHSQ